MKSSLIIVLILVLILSSETQVTAQQGTDIVIAHPGQDVELLCTVTPSENGSVAWIINTMTPYGLSTIRNGIVAGYTNNLSSNNLIVENIMINDDRNGTEYQCVILTVVMRENDTVMTEITQRSDTTILYVAGVPAMVPNVTIDYNTINVSANILTLRWGEPFNNLDPIVNYTVSCSGDAACPPNFSTTNNAIRIANLTTMTTYTFSVVATNSIGSGEAGVVMITTPPGTSVVYAIAVLDSPLVSSRLQFITVTCTIHPDSIVDQCVVMVMADGRVNRTGNAPVTNGMAVVGVNGLECGTNYTVIAGGTLNGDLVGLRSSHGTITTNPCPVCPVSSCAPCENNNNGALTGAIVGVDCAIIIIMVITNIMVWIYYFRKRDFTSKEASSELHKPTKDTINPPYHTVTDEHIETIEEPVSCKDVNRPPEIKTTPDPAYATY